MPELTPEQREQAERIRRRQVRRLCSGLPHFYDVDQLIVESHLGVWVAEQRWDPAVRDWPTEVFYATRTAILNGKRDQYRSLVYGSPESDRVTPAATGHGIVPLPDGVDAEECDCSEACPYSEELFRHAESRAALTDPVRRLMLGLTPLQRECVRLKFWQGMNYREAGEALSVGESNTKQATNRAISRMQRDLAKRGPEFINA